MAITGFRGADITVVQPLGPSAPVFTTTVVGGRNRLAEIAMTNGDGRCGISRVEANGVAQNFGTRWISTSGALLPVRPPGVLYRQDMTSITFFARANLFATARWLLWNVV